LKRLSSDIPVPEMEALLRVHLPATDDQMRELALGRGIAVRDALVAKGCRASGCSSRRRSGARRRARRRPTRRGPSFSCRPAERGLRRREPRA